MDSTGRIVRGKIKVGDRDAGQVVESLEREVFAKVDVVEGSPEGGHTKSSCRYDPLKARITENIFRERREPNSKRGVKWWPI